MKIFLVTFYTSNTAIKETIISSIKGYGAWARITPTTWCIKVNNLSAGEIRDKLSNTLTQEDRLFVVDITGANWGSYYLPKTVSGWLKERGN